MKKVYSTPIIACARLLSNEGLCITLSPGTDENPPTVADTRQETDLGTVEGKNLWESEW